jgi:hypothetical protein
MAKKVTVQLVDDYDGESVAEETVEFGVDGVSYEIDVSGEHADQLRDDFRRWVEHARRINGRKNGRAGGPRRGQLSREQTAEVREWARREGRTVATRGRLPKPLIDAFNSANSVAAAV